MNNNRQIDQSPFLFNISENTPVSLLVYDLLNTNGKEVDGYITNFQGKQFSELNPEKDILTMNVAEVSYQNGNQRFVFHPEKIKVGDIQGAAFIDNPVFDADYAMYKHPEKVQKIARKRAGLDPDHMPFSDKIINSKLFKNQNVFIAVVVTLIMLIGIGMSAAFGFSVFTN